MVMPKIVRIVSNHSTRTLCDGRAVRRLDLRLIRTAGVVVGLAAFLVMLPASAEITTLPETVVPLNLETATNIALNANPETKAASWQRKLAFAQLNEERAKKLPTLKFLENYGYSNNPLFVFGSLLMQRHVSSDILNVQRLNHPHPVSNFFSAGFVHIPLFTQLQTHTAIAQKRIETTRATREQEFVAQRIRFDSIKAFYGVILALSKRDVALNAVHSAEAELARMKALRQAGSIVLSDELAMEVQLSEFQEQLAQAEGDVTVANAELRKVLGEASTQGVVLQGVLTDKVFVPVPIEQGIQQALISRPDLVQAQLLVSQRQEGIRGAYGKYLPRVDAYGAVIQDGNAVVNGGTSLALMVNMTIDVLDLTKPAKVAEAKAERQIAEAQRAQKSNEVSLDVIRAYQSFDVAQKKRLVAKTAVDHAQETVRIIRDRYRVGLSQVTELLRAETALVRAQSNLLSARYDYYVGYADILRATGRFTDVIPFCT